MELTIQQIDELCHMAKEAVDSSAAGNPIRKIDAIKAVRVGLGVGLREAKDYVDAYFPSRILQKFRDDMLRIAGLVGTIEVMEHEDPNFHLKVKDPNVTYEDLARFLDRAWEELHKPKLTS